MTAYLVQLVSVIDGKIFISVYKLFATIVLELEPTVHNSKILHEKFLALVHTYECVSLCCIDTWK